MVNYKLAKKSMMAKAKRRARPAARKPKVTAPVKRYVKRALASEIERKYAPQLTLADSVDVAGAGLNYNGVGSLNGWCSLTNLIPQIGAGASEGARIGNRITPKSFYLKYSLRALPTTDSSASVNSNPFRGVPFMVRVVVFQHRWAFDEASQLGMLQNGNSSEIIGSTVDDLFKPYNKDEYRIFHSKTYLMSAIQHQSGTGNSTIATENVPAGAKTFLYRSAKIKLPKTLRYAEDGVMINQCLNAGMFVACCVINTDNSAISTTQRRLNISMESNLTFTDA